MAEHAEMLQGRRGVRPLDVTTAVGSALRATVAAEAMPEESAAYAAEEGLRKERARRAAVAVLVAEVDRHVVLDDADRDALSRAFSESYHERWRPAVGAVQSGILVGGSTLLPGVEQCVERALGPQRKAEWLDRREQSRKLAAAAGHPMQHPGAGTVQLRVEELRVEAFGNGNRQQVIVNGKQVFVGGAGGQIQVRIQAGGAVDIRQAGEPLDGAKEAAPPEGEADDEDAIKGAIKGDGGDGP